MRWRGVRWLGVAWCGHSQLTRANASSLSPCLLQDAVVKEKDAATKMQAMFRGYRLRRDLEYDYAAVRVQVP